MTRQTYFIQGEMTRLIKIGKSYNVELRLRVLQKNSPDKLILLGVVLETKHSEEKLHQMFAASRRMGEYFEPTNELLDFIEKEARLPVPISVEPLPVAASFFITPGAIAGGILGRRKALGWSQFELAERAGVSRPLVIKLEKGHARAELGIVLRVLSILGLRLRVEECYGVVSKR